MWIWDLNVKWSLLKLKLLTKLEKTMKYFSYVAEYYFYASNTISFFWKKLLYKNALVLNAIYVDLKNLKTLNNVQKYYNYWLIIKSFNQLALHFTYLNIVIKRKHFGTKITRKNQPLFSAKTNSNISEILDFVSCHTGSSW
jgi:hypothetical protein